MSINEKMTAIADKIRELSGATGTMGLDAMATHVGNANDEVNEQVQLLAQAVQALESKASGGGTREQATPVISVNSSTGLITATAGTKSSTHQLEFQAAKTITPTTTNQTIAAGIFLTGDQTIKGDSNLVASNIKSGVSIFGVSGNYEGGSSDSGNSNQLADFLGNTLTTLDNSIVTSLRTRICQGATKLVTVNLPSVTSTGSYAFYQCSALVTVKLPKLTTISTQTFYSCTKLKYADCGQLNNIPAQTFNACSALTALILRKTNSICTLSNVNGVNNSPIGKGTGYVYVPSALIETYKTATNWSTFANQFRSLEDYTIDGTIYGELDESKI